MTATVSSTTVRLAVRGVAGTADLVVPGRVRVDAVAREYAEAVGLADVPRLAAVGGQLLPPEQTVHALGLRHGAVLAALDQDTVSASDAGHDAVTGSASRSAPARGTALMALVAGLAAAVAATYAGDGQLRATAAVVLLLGAGVALLLPAPGRQVTRVAAPGLAAAGAFAGLHDGSVGTLLLAVSVAGLAAGATAALGRTDRDPRLDAVMRVWVGAAGVVTVVAALLLVVGAGDHALWAVLLATAVLVAKLLPGSVVDVPDHLLLDLERLAVTAWTARDRPTRGRRRRMTVQPESVLDVVQRGHVLIAAVTVSVAVAALVSAPLLLVAAGEESGSVALGAPAEVFLAGASLALMSRSYRARLPRLVLRVAGGWCLLMVCLWLVAGLEQPQTLAAVGGVAVVAVVVLMTAVAMGNGWRSVWWARAGEILEEVCVAFCLAVLPVAAGLFAFVRQLTS